MNHLDYNYYNLPSVINFGKSNQDCKRKIMPAIFNTISFLHKRVCLYSFYYRKRTSVDKPLLEYMSKKHDYLTLPLIPVINNIRALSRLAALSLVVFWRVSL